MAVLFRGPRRHHLEMTGGPRLHESPPAPSMRLTRLGVCGTDTTPPDRGGVRHASGTILDHSRGVTSSVGQGVLATGRRPGVPRPARHVVRNSTGRLLRPVRLPARHGSCSCLPRQYGSPVNRRLP